MIYVYTKYSLNAKNAYYPPYTKKKKSCVEQFTENIMLILIFFNKVNALIQDLVICKYGHFVNLKMSKITIKNVRYNAR